LPDPKALRPAPENAWSHSDCSSIVAKLPRKKSAEITVLRASARSFGDGTRYVIQL